MRRRRKVGFTLMLMLMLMCRQKASEDVLEALGASHVQRSEPLPRTARGIHITVHQHVQGLVIASLRSHMQRSERVVAGNVHICTMCYQQRYCLHMTSSTRCQQWSVSSNSTPIDVGTYFQQRIAILCVATLSS